MLLYGSSRPDTVVTGTYISGNNGQVSWIGFPAGNKQGVHSTPDNYYCKNIRLQITAVRMNGISLPCEMFFCLPVWKPSHCHQYSLYGKLLTSNIRITAMFAINVTPSLPFTYSFCCAFIIFKLVAFICCPWDQNVSCAYYCYAHSTTLYK